MCIIAIKPKGKQMFADETIRVMYANNPDGAGYMFYDKEHKKVCIKKGFLQVEDLIKSLHSRDFTHTNVVMHFRIGTSGLNDKLNCHPFPIYQKNKLKCFTNLGMAHNGILRDYEPPKDSLINDTQMFIQCVLSQLGKGFQNDANCMALLEELIGTNKLAFLDNKNHLHLVGNFVEDDGYIFSNSSYKQPRVKKMPRGTTPTNVSTSRFKLSDSEINFWHDEPNDFWDDWDRRHK